MNNNIDVVGSGVKFLDREQLVALAAKALGTEHKVLLICDIAGNKSEEQVQGYIDALEIADVLDSDNSELLNIPHLQLIVVPFKSLSVAEEVYRNIPHATHFVTFWLDGKPYAGAC